MESNQKNSLIVKIGSAGEELSDATLQFDI